MIVIGFFKVSVRMSGFERMREECWSFWAFFSQMWSPLCAPFGARTLRSHFGTTKKTVVSACGPMLLRIEPLLGVALMKLLISKRYKNKKQVIGKDPDLEKSERILNRVIAWSRDGITIEADQRHVRETSRTT